MKVSAVLRLLRQDGWSPVAIRGSHRQYKHRTKSGRVTIAGKQNDDLAPGTLNSILKQAGLKKQGTFMRYAIVIENAGTNFSAYVPDLPGCVATGATPADAERSIVEAIELHLEGMRRDGAPIPAASSHVEYVEIAAIDDRASG